MEPYAALLVGAFGALVYTGTSRAMTYFEVDDPVDGTGVHLGCGLWGTLSVGFFSTERLQAIAGFNHTHYGLAYGGGGRLLLCQVIGIAVIGAMVTVTIAPLFLLLRAFGILRVTADQEEAGIDEICHGGAAYPEDVRPWDTIVRENSLESPTSPSTVVLPGQGSLDPDAIDSLMGSDKSHTGSFRPAGRAQGPRFATTGSRSMQPTGGDGPLASSAARPLAAVVDADATEAPALRLSRSADPSGGGASQGGSTGGRWRSCRGGAARARAPPCRCSPPCPMRSSRGDCCRLRGAEWLQGGGWGGAGRDAVGSVGAGQAHRCVC